MKIPIYINATGSREVFSAAWGVHVFSILALLAASAAQGEGVLTATLSFETESLDFEAGTVKVVDIPGEADRTGIQIAYNALRSSSAVVVPVQNGVLELAFVADVAFDGITAESVANLTFSTEPVDVPFSAADTVVVRTGTGSIYKLGNAVEDGLSVSFNYSQLQ